MGVQAGREQWAQVEHRDLATFGQMFLNGGTYGSTQILSKPTVTAMTRNQTPGVPVSIFGQSHSEAGWGFGWAINVGEKWAYYISELEPLGSFGHGGFGGAALRVDPANGFGHRPERAGHWLQRLWRSLLGNPGPIHQRRVLEPRGLMLIFDQDVVRRR